MTPHLDITRRHFFSRASTGIGIAALASLLRGEEPKAGALPGLPHFAPKAKQQYYSQMHLPGGTVRKGC